MGSNPTPSANALLSGWSATKLTEINSLRLGDCYPAVLSGSMSDVSRHTYLAQRKGSANWYFKAKVPRDLVAAFEGRQQVWKSLRTTDLVEAKRRVRDEADAFDKRCRALRDRTETDGRDTVGSLALTSLSEAAIEEMVVAWFQIESVAREQRHKTALPVDPSEALQVLDQDESDLLDPDDLGLNGTYQAAVRLLRANDIRLVRRPLMGLRSTSSVMPFVVAREDAASSQFGRLLAQLRRGQIEDVRRSRAFLTGDFRDETVDPLFKPRDVPNGKTLGQVITAFRAEPERAGQITKLRQTYDAVFRLAEELFETDRPIREISREDCKTFRTTVQSLPANATKRFPGKSLMEATKLAGEDVDRLSVTTVNHYLTSLATLFNYAEKEGWLSQSPAKGLALKGVKKEPPPRSIHRSRTHRTLQCAALHGLPGRFKRLCKAGTKPTTWRTLLDPPDQPLHRYAPRRDCAASNGRRAPISGRAVHLHCRGWRRR